MSEGLLPIHRWTSIGRTQDEKTLKRLQNSTDRNGSSTETTQISIDKTHSSKQGSFGLGLLSIPWSDPPIQSSATDTLKASIETSQLNRQSSASPAFLLIP
ncbi:hypothetical protein ERO13_D09G058025v2 [Gossypium hirsutum]|nr:hypothetical protein ERO13_D09G058025v2 [Gossypium hirsutum]